MMVSTISIWSIKFCNFYISHARLRIHNIWKCFTYSFVGEKQGEVFFYLKKKKIDAEVLK